MNLRRGSARDAALSLLNDRETIEATLKDKSIPPICAKAKAKVRRLIEEACALIKKRLFWEQVLLLYKVLCLHVSELRKVNRMY